MGFMTRWRHRPADEPDGALQIPGCICAPPGAGSCTCSPEHMAAGCAPGCKLIQAYLDGETDTLTSGAVAEHLSTCQRCRTEADADRHLHQELQNQVPVDDAMLQRLRQFAQQCGQGNPPQGRDVPPHR